MIAAAVEAAMSGDGAITAQEVQLFSRSGLTPTCCGTSTVKIMCVDMTVG